MPLEALPVNILLQSGQIRKPLNGNEEFETTLSL
jgi:hypothetical protein